MMGCATVPAFAGGARTGTRSDSAVGGKRDAEAEAAAAERKACMCGGILRAVGTPPNAPPRALPFVETGLFVLKEDAELGARRGRPP